MQIADGGRYAENLIICNNNTSNNNNGSYLIKQIDL